MDPCRRSVSRSKFPTNMMDDIMGSSTGWQHLLSSGSLLTPFILRTFAPGTNRTYLLANPGRNYLQWVDIPLRVCLQSDWYPLGHCSALETGDSINLNGESHRPAYDLIGEVDLVDYLNIKGGYANGDIMKWTQAQPAIGIWISPGNLIWSTLIGWNYYWMCSYGHHDELNNSTSVELLDSQWSRC
jgi:hypothetical protein